MLIALCLTAWGIGIEARLVYVQIYRYDDYVARAKGQQENTVDLQARRGDIVDRNGAMLALSVDAQSIYAHPRLVQNADETVTKICAALGGCPDEERTTYLKRLHQKRAFVYLRRWIAPDESARVTALDLPGISTMAEPRRFYPNRELAAHVIGYVDPDGKGLGGIEAAYDSKISGQKGALLLEVAGKSVLTTHVKCAPTPGTTIELTIDKVLQHFVERELHEAVVYNRAAGGTALVMIPQTGEVLALANEPTYNPNAYGDSKPEDRRNRGVQDLYEPGSTFKVVTASAALEEHAWSTGDLIDVSAGAIRFGSREVKDVHAMGVLSFIDVIVNSSNVGAIKIGLRLGAERLGRYIHRFGFGSRLCPDVQGETAGLLSDPGKWSESTLASVSMGYEIGVTPLQMATAVSAVANGGSLVQPRLVRALRRGDQRSAVAPVEIRRSISPDTAAELLSIMEQVVDRGTGKSARIPGYTVAGKTGTAAKIINGHYSKTEYHSSFVGFVPSRQPAITVIVVIDAPHRGQIFGGAVAAPVFERIGEVALRYLGIPPTLNPIPPVLVTSPTDQPAPTLVQASSGVPPHAVWIKPMGT